MGSKRLLFVYACAIVMVFFALEAQASISQKISDLFSSKEIKGVMIDEKHKTMLSASLLSATQNPASYSGVGGGDVKYTQGALISNGPVDANAIALSRNSRRGEISVRVVREGDTLSQIAQMYGVTVNTIMWANDLSSPTDIRKDQVLVILPVAGVRHTVKSGESLSAIVSKYEADLDEVLEYNSMSESESLAVGSVLIIPNGVVEAPVRIASRPTPTNVSASHSASTVSGGGAQLSHPLPGSVRTQGLHGWNAVDFGAAIGTPIRASAAGEVVVARGSGWNGGYGNYVVIRHGNGVQTLYAHMHQVQVSAGQYVGQGQTIGTVGNTGRSTGPHLHFEVRGGTNPF